MAGDCWAYFDPEYENLSIRIYPPRFLTLSLDLCLSINLYPSIYRGNIFVCLCVSMSLVQSRSTGVNCYFMF